MTHNTFSGFDLIILDCDGVLVDSEMLSCACLADLLSEHEYPIDTAGVLDKFLGRSFAAVEQEYLAVFGRPLPNDFLGTYHARLKACFAELLCPMPGMEALLERLNGAAVCIASSSDQERLSFTLERSGFAHRFGECVFSGDQVARGKPSPDLFLHAAAKMGAQPSRTLVIEDSVNGVLAGKAAGMIVWGFVGGSHHSGRDGARVLTEAGADRIVHDMAELQPA